MHSKKPVKRRAWDSLDDFDADFVLPDSPGERVDLKEKS